GAVDVLAADTAVLLHEVGHGVMDTLELDAGNARRARRFGAAAIEHGVMLSDQFRDRLVDADIDAAMERHALALHLFDAAVDEVLFQLEVGDAVAQKAAGLRLALIDMHLVTCAAELLGGSHAGRAGTDDRNSSAGM